MAVKLSANYSKKLGLPGFSSHSFSASVEIELTDLSQVQAECQKLYALLQQSVDQEIQQVGFVPHPTQQYGLNGSCNGNGHSNGNGSDRWSCSDGQRQFILRIIGEYDLQKPAVEAQAQQMFGLGVKQLNKLQASQLIEQLLQQTGQPTGQNRWRKPQNGHRA